MKKIIILALFTFLLISNVFAGAGPACFTRIKPLMQEIVTSQMAEFFAANLGEIKPCGTNYVEDLANNDRMSDVFNFCEVEVAQFRGMTKIVKFFLLTEELKVATSCLDDTKKSLVTVEKLEEFIIRTSVGSGANI